MFRGWLRTRGGDADDPFAVLGVPARSGLSDEDVRAAWRRIAAACHPDRDDGGDPPRFAVAAAAYATLRTSDGRGEALADLGARPRGTPSGTGPFANSGPWRRAAGQGPATWMLRLLVAAAVCAGSFVAAGWSPATVGIFAGVLTWLGLYSFRRLPARHPPPP